MSNTPCEDKSEVEKEYNDWLMQLCSEPQRIPKKDYTFGLRAFIAGKNIQEELWEERVKSLVDWMQQKEVDFDLPEGEFSFEDGYKQAISEVKYILKDDIFELMRGWSSAVSFDTEIRTKQ